MNCFKFSRYPFGCVVSAYMQTVVIMNIILSACRLLSTAIAATTAPSRRRGGSVAAEEEEHLYWEGKALGSNREESAAL